VNTPKRILGDAARARLDEYLDAVEQALTDSGMSRAERRTICDEIESQAREMVFQRAQREPTEQDISAVLAELDDPEAYRDVAEPAGQAPAAGRSTDEPRVHPFALWAFVIPFVVVFLIFVPFPRGEKETFIWWGVVSFLCVVLAVMAIRDIHRRPDRYRGVGLAVFGMLGIPLMVFSVFAYLYLEGINFLGSLRACRLVENRDVFEIVQGTIIVVVLLVLSALVFLLLYRCCRPRKQAAATRIRSTGDCREESDVIHPARASTGLPRSESTRPIERLLDWLDQRNPFQFVGILYIARWVALVPVLAIEHFALTEAQRAAASVPESLKEVPLPALFISVVVVAPLVETLLECSLPYLILSRIRDYARSRPRRCWGFVVISACVMVVLHPVLGALLPALVTGAFLAYCYAHFAATNAWKAIFATAVFHAAINLVGWAMLVSQ